MENVEKYESNPEFLEFLNREFNKVAVNSTLDELAEFAFGSTENAIKEFENKGRCKDETV